MNTVTALIRPFTGPVVVTQAFGHVLDAEPQGYRYADGSIGYTVPGEIGHWHNGVDYALGCGTPVIASGPGKVVFAGWDTTGFGNCIRIDHGDFSTVYAHLSHIDIQFGSKVQQGQQIGLSGTTGNSSGCHLHWSVIRKGDGHYVDPSPYMVLNPPKLPSTPVASLHYSSSQDVPMFGVHKANFSAVTQSPHVQVYDGPSRKCVNLGELANVQSVMFDLWMFGDGMLDPTTKVLDYRWYHVKDWAPILHGWVASADVNGNAPDSRPNP